VRVRAAAQVHMTRIFISGAQQARTHSHTAGGIHDLSAAAIMTNQFCFLWAPEGRTHAHSRSANAANSAAAASLFRLQMPRLPNQFALDCYYTRNG
jgi:hypothetical protein